MPPTRRSCESRPRLLYPAALTALIALVLLLFVLFGRGSAIGGTWQAVLAFHAGLAWTVSARLRDIGLPSRAAVVFVLGCGALSFLLMHLSNNAAPWTFSHRRLMAAPVGLALFAPPLLAVALAFPRGGWGSDRRRREDGISRDS